MLRIKVVEETKTRVICTIFPENRAIFEIMWKNMAEPGRPEMTTRRIRIACCLTKATDTHSEYVLLLLNGDSG
jgi:hypothetical protein